MLLNKSVCVYRLPANSTPLLLSRSCQGSHGVPGRAESTKSRSGMRVSRCERSTPVCTTSTLHGIAAALAAATPKGPNAGTPPPAPDVASIAASTTETARCLP